MPFTFRSNLRALGRIEAKTTTPSLETDIVERFSQVINGSSLTKYTKMDPLVFFTFNEFTFERVTSDMVFHLFGDEDSPVINEGYRPSSTVYFDVLVATNDDHIPLDSRIAVYADGFLKLELNDSFFPVAEDTTVTVYGSTLVWTTA